LYYGDNLQVLRTLPTNSIDLIYIDPPFFSGAEYNVIWGDTNEIRTFSDIWDGGLPTYLVWLNARLWEMRRVLKGTGSIYVHCDYHASHYIKAGMDKTFGYEYFQNGISWQRSLPHGNAGNRFASSTDTILIYNKSKEHTWNLLFLQHRDEYVKEFYRFRESDGRVYRLISCITPNKNRRTWSTTGTALGESGSTLAKEWNECTRRACSCTRRAGSRPIRGTSTP